MGSQLFVCSLLKLVIIYSTGFVTRIDYWNSLYESSVIAECMSSCAPTKYKTTNWSSYNHSLKQRRSFLIWSDPEMV